MAAAGFSTPDGIPQKLYSVSLSGMIASTFDRGLAVSPLNYPLWTWVLCLAFSCAVLVVVLAKLSDFTWKNNYRKKLDESIRPQATEGVR
jgi:hypothetical protein